MGIYKVFNKCDKEFLELFKIKSEEISFNFEEEDRSIVSYSFNSEVTDWEKRNNKLIINLRNTCKILYSLENVTGIHVNSKEINTHTAMEIPKSYEGENIDTIIKNNEIRVNSSVEDLIVTSEKKDDIKILIIILVWIDIKKKPSIVYKVTIGPSEEYLYISYSDGERIKQINFSTNNKYNNILFSPWKNEIFYIREYNNEYFIEDYNVDSTEVISLYKEKNIKGIYIYSTNKLLVHINNGQEILKIINLINGREKDFINISKGAIKEIAISNNMLAMCVDEDNKKYLKVVYKSGKEILSKEGPYRNIYINEKYNYLIGIYKKNICLISMEDMREDSISFNNKKILNYKFIEKEKILVNCTEEEKSYIILKDLINGNEKEMFSCVGKIEDYNLNYSGDIICSYKENSTSSKYILNNKNISGNSIRIFMKGR